MFVSLCSTWEEEVIHIVGEGADNVGGRGGNLQSKFS